MSIRRIFLTGLVGAAFAAAYSGSSFSEKFEAMPQAAQETATANMKDALPLSIGSVKGEQGWQYQVNTRLNGESHNLVINEKGELLAVKDGTDLASVPGAVKAAIETEAAASKIVTLEKVTERGLVSYGVVIEEGAPGKYIRVRLAVDGTIKSKSRQDTDR